MGLWAIVLEPVPRQTQEEREGLWGWEDEMEIFMGRMIENNCDLLVLG